MVCAPGGVEDITILFLQSAPPPLFDQPVLSFCFFLSHFRRKLIELEDAAMQISLDMNRYMLVIDEYVTNMPQGLTSKLSQ